MKNILTILMVTIFILPNIIFAEEKTPEWQSEFASSSVKSAIIHIYAEQCGIESDAEDQNIIGLVHALALINTPESLKAIVDLSDYSFGTAAREDLTALIVNKGETIKPLLLKKRGSPISCVNNKLCQTLEERNNRIDSWLKLIDKGKKIELIP